MYIESSWQRLAPSGMKSKTRTSLHQRTPRKETFLSRLWRCVMGVTETYRERARNTFSTEANTPPSPISAHFRYFTVLSAHISARLCTPELRVGNRHTVPAAEGVQVSSRFQHFPEGDRSSYEHSVGVCRLIFGRYFFARVCLPVAPDRLQAIRLGLRRLQKRKFEITRGGFVDSPMRRLQKEDIF